MYESLANLFSSILQNVLKKLGFEEQPARLSKTSTFPSTLPFTPIVPPREWGIAFILPQLAKANALKQVAEELKAVKDLPAIIARCEAEGIYLNLYFDPKQASNEVLSKILYCYHTNDHLSLFQQGKRTRERVMIEFSQPNTHKEFHVGHLRNVLIGNAISNLYSFLGYSVVRANYYGDHGIHIAKTLWGFKKFYNCQIPSGVDPAEFLGEVYTRAEISNREAENTEEGKKIEEEQLAILGNILQDGTEENKLWLKTRQYFLAKFREIYEELGVKFDVEFFESEVERKGREIVKELVERGVARCETSGEYVGTIYVDFSELNAPHLGKMVLIRSDGTSLYQTKELALAKEKFTSSFKARDGSEGGIDISLYLVGSEQKLYFQQLFKILEAWGFPQAKNCKHVSYELVQLATGKMSSREGTIISYSDFLNEAKVRARRLTDERGISADKGNVSALVALGAIKYAFLKVSPDKPIIFDWNTALTFDGNSGPYIQYAYARARKLILDFIPSVPDNASLIKDGVHLTDEEIYLCRVLMDFPTKLKQALSSFAVSIICGYIYELTRAFTSFYDTCPVLSSDEPTRTFRRTLVFCFVRVLEWLASDILGIKLPEEM